MRVSAILVPIMIICIAGTARGGDAGSLEDTTVLAADTAIRLTELKKQLTDENQQKRLLAITHLKLMGKAGARAIIEAIEHADPQVRDKAITSIDASWGEAVPALIKATNDPDATVRASAYGAMARIRPRPREAVGLLTKALQDKDAGVRLTAARVLYYCDPENATAVPALTDALADADRYVRYESARTLGSIGPAARAAIPALLKIAKNQGDHAREAALWALAGISPESKDVLGVLTDGLQDHDPCIRTCAAASVGRMGPRAKEAVDLLLERLSDEDATVCATIAGTLKAIGTESERKATTVLKGLMVDKNVSVRVNAAYALWSITKEAEPSVDALIRALDTGDASVRAAQVLSLMGADAKKAVPALTKKLRVGNPVMQQNVARALGEIGFAAKTAIPDLRVVAQNADDKDAEVRSAAFCASSAISRIESSRADGK